MGLLKGYTKQEKSWMLYDWANSAHAVVIVTILPIFYNTVAEFTSDAASSMNTWGYCTSTVMLLIAIMAPILGVLGDFKRMRKRLFCCFLVVGVSACAFLAVTPLLDFVNPEVAEKVGLAILILYSLSQIGYSGANLYYDSFLTDVTTKDRMDRVSTMGYAMGYLGGSTVPLVVFLSMAAMGVDMLICLSVIFGLTAVWWFLFSIPFLKNVHQTSAIESENHAIRKAFQGLATTLKQIVHRKDMFFFLLAYFFYIDGVNTIIHMSTSYGDTLGIGSVAMMIALLLVQLVGLPFCLLYIRLAEKFGARIMVGVGICVYMFITIFGFFVREVWHFWFLAFMIGTSQGGIQALSRSMFGKMIPDQSRSGEFFGFYDIFGRFSAILGPSLVAFSSGLAAKIIAQNQNISDNASTEVLMEISRQAAPWGVLSVLIIFLIGGGIYFFCLPKYLKSEKE